MDPDVRATDDRGIGPGAGAASEQRLLSQALPYDLRSRIRDVGQDAGGDEEDVVLDLRASVDRNIVLHLDVRPQPGTDGQEVILTQVASRPDCPAPPMMCKKCR